MQQKPASTVANACRGSVKRAEAGRPSQSPTSFRLAGLTSTTAANSMRSPNGLQMSRTQREPIPPTPIIKQRCFAPIVSPGFADVHQPTSCRPTRYGIREHMGRCRDWQSRADKPNKDAIAGTVFAGLDSERQQSLPRLPCSASETDHARRGVSWERNVEFEPC